MLSYQADLSKSIQTLAKWKESIYDKASKFNLSKMAQQKWDLIKALDWFQDIIKKIHVD